MTTPDTKASIQVKVKPKSQNAEPPHHGPCQDSWLSSPHEVVCGINIGYTASNAVKTLLT